MQICRSFLTPVYMGYDGKGISMKTQLSAVFLLSAALAAADDYALSSDSQRHSGIPQGKVVHSTWSSSRIYPGTTRDYWIYVPAQYNGSKPACVMVFQDGKGYQSETICAPRVPFAISVTARLTFFDIRKQTI